MALRCAFVLAMLPLFAPGAPPQEPSPALVVDAHILPARTGEQPAIVINVPQRRLFLLSGGPVVGFPIAVGRPDWPTPVGEFRVVRKEVAPAWDVPTSIQDEMRRAGRVPITRMPPGPKNPLGSHWIGLSAGSIGIHGTPEPSSLSKFATHGCIRMHPDDIGRVFASVAVGDRVLIVYEPVLVAITSDGVFLETHPDRYRRAREPAEALVRRAAGTLAVDWTQVTGALRSRDGVVRRIGPAPPAK
jgi:L,D-transpeptidase ErfK/SrfK